jgi:hypothetical protein
MNMAWRPLRFRASPVRSSTLTGDDCQTAHHPAHVVVVEPSFKLGNFLRRASMGALGGIGQAAMVVFLVFFLVVFLLLRGD